ncbi:glycerol-3-phosphate 2-O-acyltransferase 6-like [Triticum dicoccoides]|uniref:glycerol-3-phosphate 2-O-acyltransferase 6-like n=1 Tax=Triticum dicoccoides TaxID=85692 RepID=UPI001890E8DE|nr:glycerol-3-phosphate 2-O-acyltransferase 6-like [Triticum dicoccoides]
MAPRPGTAAMSRFPPVSSYDAAARERRTAASDLDGTLLASSSAFPYYFLVALEAGGYLRALALLLLAPFILLLYTAVSEPAAIGLLVFATFTGLRVRDVEAVARGVLPRHYAAGVRADSWEVFRGCGAGRRVVVTASPAVMVSPFVREFLGAEVAGTELGTFCGRFTGLISGGVLVAGRKREVVERLFAGGDMPDVGLGDRESDHDFMAICKEAYMVPTNKRAPRAAPDALLSRVVFHDGRLVRRPDPAHALFMVSFDEKSALAYLPVGFALAVLHVLISLSVLRHLVRHTYRLTGIRLAVRGTAPPAPRDGSPGSLLVCNHRTALDPIIVAVALGRPVTCVTYSVSRLSMAISPIPAVALARDREADAARIAALLSSGRDVVVCPEGTTCREPCLLRFSALFAELTDRIVPVALEASQSTYYGSTARGWKALDPWFFYMNPRPGYKVTFLPALRPEDTCGAGGRSAVDVANHVQAVIAKELGYRCTTLTRKDKYMKLAGNDGTVATAGDDGRKFA